MRIRRIATRTINWLSVAVVLPLVLALPLMVFAEGNNGNHGEGDNGNHYGNPPPEHGNSNRGRHGNMDTAGDYSDGGGNVVGAAGAVDNAPEINLAAINSAMALLVGGAMWLRHRK